jgi:hypothetical protein
MRDEYLRLERHHLYTETTEIEKFCGFSQYNNTTDDKTESFIVCTFNIQSLVAHNLDLSSGSVTSPSDYLALTETWMDKDKTFDIPGFKESNQCDRHGDDDNQQPSTSHATGKECSGLYVGTAVFKNQKICRAHVAIPVPRWPILKYTAFNCLQDVHVGEGVLMEVEMPNQFKFVLVSVYIQPQTPLNYIEMFLSANALPHRACQNNS